MRAPILPVALVVAASAGAWLCGAAVSETVARRVAAPPPLPKAHEAVADRPRTVQMSKPAWTRPVVRRDIFGTSGAAAPGADGPVRDSDLSLVLLATMVAEPAEASSALLAPARGEPAQGFGVGDALARDATLVAIDHRSVRVERADGTIEAISLATGVPASAPPEAGADPITLVATDRYAVARSLVDRIIENPESLYARARAAPHLGPSGEADGYRLSGIRRATLLHQLGVRNGDVLHSVDGVPVTRTADALEALQSLASASTFSLELTRRTQTRTLTFEIR